MQADNLTLWPRHTYQKSASKSVPENRCQSVTRLSCNLVLNFSGACFWVSNKTWCIFVPVYNTGFLGRVFGADFWYVCHWHYISPAYPARCYLWSRTAFVCLFVCLFLSLWIFQYRSAAVTDHHAYLSWGEIWPKFTSSGPKMPRNTECRSEWRHLAKTDRVCCAWYHSLYYKGLRRSETARSSRVIARPLYVLCIRLTERRL